MSALNTRLDTVFADVTGHLFAELQDKELEAAVTLKKNNLRAAGTIAGIVLERHLQRVAKNHGITLPKESPTIADLNESLKSKGTYDVPTWRKIQLLSDLSRSIRFL